VNVRSKRRHTLPPPRLWLLCTDLATCSRGSVLPAHVNQRYLLTWVTLSLVDSALATQAAPRRATNQTASRSDRLPRHRKIKHIGEHPSSCCARACSRATQHQRRLRIPAGVNLDEVIRAAERAEW